MATNTTNYNLTKPEPNDYYDIDVTNSNLDIIDAALALLNQYKGPWEGGESRAVLDLDNVEDGVFPYIQNSSPIPISGSYGNVLTMTGRNDNFRVQLLFEDNDEPGSGVWIRKKRVTWSGWETFGASQALINRIAALESNTVKINSTNSTNTLVGFQGTATRVFTTNFGNLGENGDFTVLVPKANFNGTIEINITSQYANTNATGGMKVIFHSGFYDTMHYFEKEVLECSSVLNEYYFVEDLLDDGNTFYFRIIKRQPNAVNGTRIAVTFTGPSNADYLARNCTGVYQARVDSLPFGKNFGVTQEITSLKNSGVSAKTLIANALTAKGVPSNSNEDFSVYASKITALPTKRSASGTVEAINSSNVFPLSTGVTSPFTTVRVDGLGFRPSKINIWRKNGLQRFITMYDARSEPYYAFVGDFQSNSSSSNINYVDVSSANYLYDGGFFFPVRGSGSEIFEWYAEE